MGGSLSFARARVDAYLRRPNRNSRAVSPAISTVVLTGTMVALLSVAVVFVNNRLWTSVAEGDFNSAKQFMQTVGLQIDDVAWTMGRKATVRYTSTYGALRLLPSALNYTIYVKTQESGSYQFFTSYKVGVLLFDVPVSKFSLYDGYYELIYPASASNLTFAGASAPIARVFGVEKLTPPMSDGSFARVVVTPSIRSLSSNMTTASSSTFYVRLYLPVLVQGMSSGASQSVTLTGSSVTAKTKNQVTSVKITVDFPNGTYQQGFDSSFFHFSSLSQVVDLPSGYTDAVLEFYSGMVDVELGVHT